MSWGEMQLWEGFWSLWLRTLILITQRGCWRLGRVRWDGFPECCKHRLRMCGYGNRVWLENSPRFQDCFSLNCWLTIFSCNWTRSTGKKYVNSFWLYNSPALLLDLSQTSPCQRRYLNLLLFAALFTVILSSRIAKSCWRGWFSQLPQAVCANSW